MGLLEECVGIDDQILREVIIPVMAIDRRAEDGTTNAQESLNKSQIYVTTAGYKGTYPYDRLIGMLVRMITQPERCMVLGGTWRTPVAVGLQRKTFIKDQKEEGTYNEASFEREYESIWSGTAEDAFFDGNKFDTNRILLQPEYEASGRISKLAYYVIGVDVGRKGCQTVATVIKVTPQSLGNSIKSIVNIYTFNEDHFEDQAIKLKQLFYKYKAKRIVIDGNGLGAGLMDYMVKSQVDDNNDTLPDFGVYGGTYDGADQEFKKYRTPITEQDAIYVIKANAPINTAIYSTMKSQLDSGKIKFLIDERVAKIKLLGTKRGQQMTPEQRADYLRPYTITSILKEEMMNLREEEEGLNIKLKPVNRTTGHDKVSSIIYGIYYICSIEEDRKKRKRFNAKEWNFFN